MIQIKLEEEDYINERVSLGRRNLQIFGDSPERMAQEIYIQLIAVNARLQILIARGQK